MYDIKITGRETLSLRDLDSRTAVNRLYDCATVSYSRFRSRRERKHDVHTERYEIKLSCGKVVKIRRGLP